jgi:hypothetical protein
VQRNTARPRAEPDERPLAPAAAAAPPRARAGRQSSALSQERRKDPLGCRAGGHRDRRVFHLISLLYFKLEPKAFTSAPNGGAPAAFCWRARANRWRANESQSDSDGVVAAIHEFLPAPPMPSSMQARPFQWQHNDGAFSLRPRVLWWEIPGPAPLGPRGRIGHRKGDSRPCRRPQERGRGRGAALTLSRRSRNQEGLPGASGSGPRASGQTLVRRARESGLARGPGSGVRSPKSLPSCARLRPEGTNPAEPEPRGFARGFGLRTSGFGTNPGSQGANQALPGVRGPGSGVRGPKPKALAIPRKISRRRNYFLSPAPRSFSIAARACEWVGSAATAAL